MEFINRIIHALTELHPLHPMFVHFPIALTGAAFLFILLAHWRENQSFEQVAFANITLSAVSTVFAGITGIMDNIRNYVGEAPHAGLKVILAVVLLLLTTGISLVRFRTPDMFLKRNRAVYIASYAASFGLALVLAFLGGVILYGF